MYVTTTYTSAILPLLHVTNVVPSLAKMNTIERADGSSLKEDVCMRMRVLPTPHLPPILVALDIFESWYNLKEFKLLLGGRILRDFIGHKGIQIIHSDV